MFMTQYIINIYNSNVKMIFEKKKLFFCKNIKYLNKITMKIRWAMLEIFNFSLFKLIS